MKINETWVYGRNGDGGEKKKTPPEEFSSYTLDDAVLHAIKGLKAYNSTVIISLYGADLC